jgi:hypothetical protein
MGRDGVPAHYEVTFMINSTFDEVGNRFNNIFHFTSCVSNNDGNETEELFDGRGEDRKQIGVARKVKLSDRVRRPRSDWEAMYLSPHSAIRWRLRAWTALPTALRDHALDLSMTQRRLCLLPIPFQRQNLPQCQSRSSRRSQSKRSRLRRLSPPIGRGRSRPLLTCRRSHGPSGPHRPIATTKTMGTAS